jgi:uncharacterized membrane protein
MNQALSGKGESRLENAISYVLIGGVLISMALEIAGMALFYRAYGHLAISQEQSVFIEGHDFFSFVYGEFTRHTRVLPIAVMTAGIMVLILTPYVRVVLSVFYFVRYKNVKYAVITLLVLTILSVSLALH